MLKLPTTKDVTDNKSLTPAQTVRALYSAQWKFYRDGYHLMLRIAAVEALLIVIMGTAILFLSVIGTPEPKYFARNAQNQIVEMYPLSEPQKTDDQVRQFVTDAVLESMNFTYDDYKLRLQKASTFFTDNGFAGWDDALRSSKIYQQLEEKQLLMRTTLVSTPQIDKVNSKAYAGKYIWMVYVDVQRTLSDKVETKSATYRYKVYIQQVQTSERHSGLAIYSIKEEMSAVR